METRWRFKNAWKCHKCPQSNDENGCPAWWDFANANGGITKGCALHKDVLLNILWGVLHEASCAAASADKATNAAAESAIAAQSTLKASTTGTAIMLGMLTGEIRPATSIIEDRSNGDCKILPASRTVD